VLTAPVVLPGGLSDVPLPETDGPSMPVAPEPLTDGGHDRLVVVTPPAVPARPSATLVAAQQVSEEAGRHPYRSRGAGTAAGNRRRRAVLAQRRADRSGRAER
jgi:hypothetical protein